MSPATICGVKFTVCPLDCHLSEVVSVAASTETISEEIPHNIPVKTIRLINTITEKITTDFLTVISFSLSTNIFNKLLNKVKRLHYIA